ncbi:MAG: hypothetical protein DI635_13560 [Pseudoxanthomonas suwonensis]|nr:MAG: hypothetical protein DI635_13560 [Pseudoxanthomonas suwonensis]
MIGELDASAQLLQSILDTVDVGIVVVDADGHDILMNSRQRRNHALATPPGNDDPGEAELLLRYPGTSLPIPADERPVRRAVLQESFSNYLVATGPPGEDGAAFSVSARQILDQRGERAGAVVVFSDVTSYLETVRSQEQFVAAVSHELRTPLTSVIGYLELAQDDLDLSKETASYLQVAHRNAEQLLVIVGDLALISDLQPTPEMPVDTARNSDIPGHGIGLSLTRRIVVSHNGQISVRSQPGEGSTFRIRFAVE